jgi:steroid 5-alpha reductase family enzyme
MVIVWLMITNVFIIFACTLALWTVSVRIRDVSFIDSWWPMGMVVLAGSSAVQAGRWGPHAIVLTLVCALWGLRLGGYLFWRWRRKGADPRYTAMLEDAQTRRGWRFPLASLLLVFALQAPLQIIVALPVQLGQIAPDKALGSLGWWGLVLSLFGTLFEAVADTQLAAFKSAPTNAGAVMNKGLWRYSRHPNYFGEACVWWGLYLVAAETGLGAWSLPGPVLITLLLTKGSGVPTVEGRMKDRGEDYARYIRSTSAFVPWFPRP